MTHPIEGGCACGRARYRMTRSPMFVHCCHCRWCQRETGAAFALNALIETDFVEILDGDTETVNTPSNSGKGQKIVRCPTCHVALWSHYAYGGIGDFVKFVRVGTLDDPSAFPPGVHIYVESKVTWLKIPEGVSTVDQYYRTSQLWPPESIARLDALKFRPHS